MPETIGGRTETAFGLLRRAGVMALVAVSIALFFGIAGTPCLVGVPIAMYALSRLVALLLHGHGYADGPSGWTGPVAYAGVAVITIFSGLAFGLTFELGILAAFVAALATGAVTGAALGPLVFAPFALADRAPGLAAGLARSFEISATIGARRTVLTGLAAGLQLVGGTLACGLLCDALVVDDGVRFSAWVLSAPVGLAVTLPWVLATIGREYSAVSAPAGSAMPKLRAIALMVIPGLLACAAALAVAALTPTPMRVERAVEPHSFERGLHPPNPARVVRLPGTSITATATSRGLTIAADDGGGAGDVEVQRPFHIPHVTVEPGERYGGPRGSFAITMPRDERRVNVTVVDRDGVRLDDGLDARVIDRLGDSGAALLGLALVMLLGLAFRVGREIGSARTIDAPALDGGGRLAALACKVHVDGDQRWLEADAIRIRLPETPRILGETRALEDGDAVMLVSRFDRGITTGLRDAFATWPRDGALVIGDRDAAASALVARASRRATWLAVPALASLLAVCAIVLFEI
jgi:hypothetical protein